MMPTRLETPRGVKITERSPKVPLRRADHTAWLGGLRPNRVFTTTTAHPQFSKPTRPKGRIYHMEAACDAFVRWTYSVQIGYAE
jgi:hypothetical protein